MYAPEDNPETSILVSLFTVPDKISAPVIDTIDQEAFRTPLGVTKVKYSEHGLGYMFNAVFVRSITDELLSEKRKSSSTNFDPAACGFSGFDEEIRTIALSGVS